MKPTIEITMSQQSFDLLHELAELGIYGENSEDVALRFIEAKLQELVKKPKLKPADRRSKKLKEGQI